MLAEYSIGDFCAKYHDMPGNYAEAVEWFRKAADQNYAPAQCSLGICYAAGAGVTQDLVEARKWFELASLQGNDDATQKMGFLDLTLTPDQIARAQQLAREFKPQRE